MSWFGFDDEDDSEEPVDEIIVIGQRTGLGARLELTGNFRYGQMFTERCSMYSDGGNCLSHERIFNREGWPLEGKCQSISGTMGPLTGSEANSLNLEYQQNMALINGSGSIAASLGAAALTSGSSALVQLFSTGAVGLGALMATYPDAGDLPFTAGATVTYSLNACNDGDGGIDADLEISIQ